MSVVYARCRCLTPSCVWHRRGESGSHKGRNRLLTRRCILNHFTQQVTCRQHSGSASKHRVLLPCCVLNGKEEGLCHQLFIHASLAPAKSNSVQSSGTQQLLQQPISQACAIKPIGSPARSHLDCQWSHPEVSAEYMT